MLSFEQYQTERAICDKAAAYAERFKQKNGWIIIPPEAAHHPDYAACNNAMRGRVEQFEIFRDMPEKFTAYLSDKPGKGWRVTTYAGDALSSDLIIKSSRKISGFMSNRYYYGRCVINGQAYAWQGHGAGVYCRLRKIKGKV